MVSQVGYVRFNLNPGICCPDVKFISNKPKKRVVEFFNSSAGGQMGRLMILYPSSLFDLKWIEI